MELRYMVIYEEALDARLLIQWVCIADQRHYSIRSFNLEGAALKDDPLIGTAESGAGRVCGDRSLHR